MYIIITNIHLLRSKLILTRIDIGLYLYYIFIYLRRINMTIVREHVTNLIKRTLKDIKGVPVLNLKS